MYRWLRCAGTVGCVVLGAVAVLADETRATRSLTLEQAVVEAYARSPRLRSRQAQVEQAEGRLRTARTYPFNPELRVEGARRSAPGESHTDRGVALGQEIEIGGQRQARATQARFELDAARAELRREEQLVTAQVRSAFIEALRTRELLEVEQANDDLARSLGEVAQKQFDAGAVAQIEVNLARVQVGRAARDLNLARGAYGLARSVLAEAAGLDPSQPPEPQGELAPPLREVPDLGELVAAATTQRPDLEALRRTIDAARARRALARREAVPNLVVEAFQGREEGTDRLTGGELGVQLPLFNRNRGSIVEAQGLERQAIAETDLAELQVRQQLAGALSRYEAAAAAAAALEQDVLGNLEENLKLLRRSFEAGKTGWTEVLIFRREFVDVQRLYIETLTEAQLAAIELDLALGIAAPMSHKESQP